MAARRAALPSAPSRVSLSLLCPGQSLNFLSILCQPNFQSTKPVPLQGGVLHAASQGRGCFPPRAPQGSLASALSNPREAAGTTDKARGVRSATAILHPEITCGAEEAVTQNCLHTFPNGLGSSRSHFPATVQGKQGNKAIKVAWGQLSGVSEGGREG